MTPQTQHLTEIQLAKLTEAAWKVRENAYVFGETKVGAALLTIDDLVFVGCNVEHRYRSHDVHAEVNAITSMVASGHKDFWVIIIAAERERFTPCGSCMDWIFQFGGADCLVGYQSHINGKLTFHTAAELMPFYPK
jgi:cytidine deaminase